MHCTYLLTQSKYFKWGQTSDFRIKSKTSLCGGECRKVMKLEVQPLETAFRVHIQDSEGGVLKHEVCKLMQVNIQDGS